jgi:hypothetical protein
VRIRRCSPALLLAGSLGSALAQTTAVWAPNDINVSQSVPERAGSTGSRFEISANGDARIAVDRREGSTHTAGTILLIAGRWMLTQGFSGAAAEQLAALDAVAVNSQLVIVLLTAALPNGAPAAGPPQHVRVAEKAKPIKITTASSSVEYGAPWTVVGAVTVQRAEGPASYELSFTYSDQGTARTMDFSGSVGSEPSPLSLPDSMKLAGWKIRRVPQSAGSAGTAGQPDSAGHGEAPKAATLGELRQLR